MYDNNKNMEEIISILCLEDLTEPLTIFLKKYCNNAYKKTKRNNYDVYYIDDISIEIFKDNKREVVVIKQTNVHGYYFREKTKHELIVVHYKYGNYEILKNYCIE